MSVGQIFSVSVSLVSQRCRTSPTRRNIASPYRGACTALRIEGAATRLPWSTTRTPSRYTRSESRAAPRPAGTGTSARTTGRRRCAELSSMRRGTSSTGTAPRSRITRTTTRTELKATRYISQNADQSRTFAVVHMHEDRLYVLEATVPPGAPSPGLFQISVRFLDKEWNPVRYEWVGTQLYSNGYPPPPRTGGQRGQGPGPQAQDQQGR